MILQIDNVPARTKLHGEKDRLVVSAGQHLRIETSPEGAEVLDAVVPAGKQWEVTIGVSIDVTDV